MAAECSTHRSGPGRFAPLVLMLLCPLMLGACAGEPGVLPAGSGSSPVPPALETRPEQETPVPCGALWDEGTPVRLRGLYRTSGDQPFLDVLRLSAPGQTPCWARFFLLGQDLGLGKVAWGAPRYVEVSGRLASDRWSSAGLWDLAVSGWAVLPLDVTEAERTCRQAVAAQTKALQALDWAGLAAPSYVTGTAGFVPAAGALAQATFQPLGVDDREPLLLLEARGPDLPAVRPLVTRWVAVECVYNLEQGRVLQLVATIRGEVQE